MSLRNSREILIHAVKQNGLSLQYASDRLKDDKEIVLFAFAQNINSIAYASKSLNNIEWIKAYLETNI